MEKYRLPLWAPLAILFAIGLAAFALPAITTGIVNLGKLSGINESWAGFAGAVLGAIATLFAGSAALFAAYKTLVPMRDQLNQLVKQNDHNLHDRLILRSVRLNEDENLIRRVVDDCNNFDRSLLGYMNNDKFSIAGGRASADVMEANAQKLCGTVRELESKKGNVWGDTSTQRVRLQFIDIAGGCCLTATRIAKAVRDFPQSAFMTEKNQAANWARLLKETNTLANRLFRRVLIEREKTGDDVAKIEVRLFGDAESRPEE
jgi:hypothetical protein